MHSQAKDRLENFCKQRENWYSHLKEKNVENIVARLKVEESEEKQMIFTAG